MNASRFCYLCRGDHFQYRKGNVRDNSDLRIMECIECGLVFLSSFTHINDEHYENSGMHLGGSASSFEAWLKETGIDDDRRFEMLRPRLAGKTVLDFGCGAGGFLHRAMSTASKVAGVELEKRVKEYWDGKIDIFHDIECIDNCYDLITAFHVIEHLKDPRSVLRSLGEKLSAGGTLVVEVPNSEDALLTLYDSSGFQDFTYWSQHLFLFNADTLAALAKQAGLGIASVCQVQRYPLSNHLYWLSRGMPGGHQKWFFLDSPLLNESYASSLAAIGKCDTLIAYLEKKTNHEQAR